MLKSSFVAISAAVLLAGAAATLATPAKAQDDMTAAWTKYQEAVRVAELCRYMKHDAAQWAKIGPYIDSKVNHEISGAERLTLIEQAKSDARTAARVKGCGSDDAKAMLSLYDAELAPLVK
jgi:ActR/RegA family two-component response regulator